MLCKDCLSFPCKCEQCSCIFLTGTHRRMDCNYFLTHFEDGTPISTYSACADEIHEQDRTLYQE